MSFPDTPRTVISQLIDEEKREVWNGAWRRFFSIYHAPIRLMVVNAFIGYNWKSVPEHILEEVVSDVVMALNKIFNEGSYKRGEGRFRHFLKQIAVFKTVDYIRRNDKRKNDLSLDSANAALNEGRALPRAFALEAEEIQSFKQSMILDAYESIRHHFSPQSCLAFEMIKLEKRSMEETVRELGMEPASVNNAIYRITKRLRETVRTQNLLEELQ